MLIVKNTDRKQAIKMIYSNTVAVSRYSKEEWDILMASIKTRKRQRFNPVEEEYEQSLIHVIHLEADHSRQPIYILYK